MGMIDDLFSEPKKAETPKVEAVAKPSPKPTPKQVDFDFMVGKDKVSIKVKSGEGKEATLKRLADMVAKDEVDIEKEPKSLEEVEVDNE